MDVNSLLSVDLQEALVIVFAPLFLYFIAFIAASATVAAAIHFILDVAADFEKS